jgi:hypothetical protein
VSGHIVTDESSDPIARTGIDTTVPHSARIWNYWLGGKDNYAVDREAGDAWVAIHPEITVIARVTRAFLQRSVRYLAGEVGIRQFLDVGTGLPTADNTHEVAQRIAPESRVVYVDNDPLVLAHARALLTSTPQGSTRYLHADMHDSAALIEGAAEILDFDQPVAVFFMGVLGHIADHDEARALVKGIMDRVPSGSYLTIADSTHPTDSDAFKKAQEDYADTGAIPYWNRTQDEIASFFDGLEWVEPGFVSVPLWRPEQPEGVTSINANPPAPLDHFGGVARKP